MQRPEHTPKRIQRKRTKGYKMPPGCVYVGRPTIWGNPFKLTDDKSLGQIVREYQLWLAGEKEIDDGGLRRFAVLGRLSELRGRDLACWCPLNCPCHADVLLETYETAREKVLASMEIATELRTK